MSCALRVEVDRVRCGGSQGELRIVWARGAAKVRVLFAQVVWSSRTALLWVRCCPGDRTVSVEWRFRIREGAERLGPTRLEGRGRLVGGSIKN